MSIKESAVHSVELSSTDHHDGRPADTIADRVVPVDELPRVITREAAIRAGFTPRAIAGRLERGTWLRILPRTYLTAGNLTWPDRLAAALGFAGFPSVISGAAALVGRGVACVTEPVDVLVLVPPRCRVRSTEWVRIRATRRIPTTVVVRTTRTAHPARAVADLSLELVQLDDVRTLVAQAVRKNLCTVKELNAELAAGPRQGSAHLRTALEDVDAGAWSAPEARASRELLAARLGGFEQNAVVLVNGQHLVVDFLWRKLRAVLEIDSVEHHLDPRDWRKTMDRHLLLTTAGYSVVHRTPADVLRDPSRFRSEIAAWLRSLTS